MADIEPTAQIIIDKTKLLLGVGIPEITVPGPGDECGPSQFLHWTQVCMILTNPEFNISVKIRAVKEYGEMWGIPMAVQERED